MKTPGEQMVLDPDLHTVHYGKGMSKMYNEYVADREVRQIINIQARGMASIRANFPSKARMIVQAIDMARDYAFNRVAQPRFDSRRQTRGQGNPESNRMPEHG
jgi:hypothetical protein